MTFSHVTEPLKLHSNDTLINERVHPAWPHQWNMNNTVLSKITKNINPPNTDNEYILAATGMPTQFCLTVISPELSPLARP